MGTTPDVGDLDEVLQGLIGKPVGSQAVVVGPDQVNIPMIRHWAAAFEDANPVYTDPDRASASRFGGIVAPPLMLQTWTMATPMITGIAERGGSPTPVPGQSPLSVLDRAGYTATLRDQFRIRDRPLPSPRRRRVRGDRVRVHLRGESDPDGPRTIRHLGHDVYGSGG